MTCRQGGSLGIGLELPAELTEVLRGERKRQRRPEPRKGPCGWLCGTLGVLVWMGGVGVPGCGPRCIRKSDSAAQAAGAEDAGPAALGPGRWSLAGPWGGLDGCVALGRKRCLLTWKFPLLYKVYP